MGQVWANRLRKLPGQAEHKNALTRTRKRFAK